jgi:radical SAM-linked protein
VRRARIPVLFSQGFHPLPRVSFGPALPLGVESLAEYLDIYVEGFMKKEEITRGLDRELPPGIKIIQTEEIPLNSQPLAVIINKAKYLVSLKDNKFFPPLKARDSDCLVKGFMAKEEAIVSRKGKDGIKRQDLRSLVDDLSCDDGFTWRLVLKGSAGPLKVIQGVFQLSEEETRSLNVLKTEVYFSEIPYKKQRTFVGR